MKSSNYLVAATSDLHGFIEGVIQEVENGKPNFLVIAGDIHPCRIDISAETWFPKVFYPFLEEVKIPVIAVPGNHDFYLNDIICKGREWGKQFPQNFHLLCDSEVIIEGIKFYGTPWVPWINGRWCFEASERSLKYVYSKIPMGIDVLISHSPPLIQHQFIDISLERPKPSWRHFGSKDLHKAIRETSPHLVFCGHIHSGNHQTHTIESDSEENVSSRVYNVSRVSEKYQVTYGLTFAEA